MRSICVIILEGYSWCVMKCFPVILNKVMQANIKIISIWVFIIYHWSMEFSFWGLHDKDYDSFWFEPLQILVNDKTASASEIVRSSISQYIICLLFHLLWWCDYRCCTYFRLLLHFMIIVELFLLENAHMARFMNIFHHCCMV